MGNTKSSRNHARRQRSTSVTDSPATDSDAPEAYELVLPSDSKPWQQLFCGNLESFRSYAVKFGFERALDPCEGLTCSQLAVCKEQIQASLENRTKRIFIKSRGRTVMVLSWTARKALMKILLHQSHRYRPYVIAMDTKCQLIVVTFQISERLFMTRHALVLDLSSRSLRCVVQPLEDEHSVLHCDFSPDSSVLGILYKNKVKGMEYDFYMVSTLTGKRLHCTTLVTSVAYPAPRFAFDTRYRFSRIAFVSRILKEGSTRHLIEIYSQADDSILKELEFAPVPAAEYYVEPTSIVYSQDGHIMIIQTMNRMSRTYCNYIFRSDDLQLLKFFRFHLFLTHNSCPINNKPAFSRCGSFMRMFDQGAISRRREHNLGCESLSSPMIKIFRLPNLIGLQYHCRRVILQNVKSFDDVNRLPIPKKMKSFIKFEPNQN